MARAAQALAPRVALSFLSKSMTFLLSSIWLWRKSCANITALAISGMCLHAIGWDGPDMLIDLNFAY
jgi:hypothetical protein